MSDTLGSDANVDRRSYYGPQGFYGPLDQPGHSRGYGPQNRSGRNYGFGWQGHHLKDPTERAGKTFEGDDKI